MRRLITALIAMALLSACAPSNALQGDWRVDVEATVRSATAAGFPHARPLILVGYEGASLRIEEDMLTIRTPSGRVVAHNYTVLGAEGGCTRLRVATFNREQRYCVERNQLMVHGLGAQFAIVFRRA